MALGEGYVYRVLMPKTGISAIKTLIQIKPGNAPIDILSARVAQATKTASELLEIQLIQYTGSPTAATVTAATPVPLTSTDPASLAVGGTSATGYNATAEPSGGTANIIVDTVFNVLNGEWVYQPTPAEMIRIAAGTLFGLKLASTPSAQMNFIASVTFIEYR